MQGGSLTLTLIPCRQAGLSHRERDVEIRWVKVNLR